MGKSGIKRFFKVVLIVLAVLLALDLTVVALLFVPKFQTFAVNKVTETLSEKWGSEFSIENVHITPTLKVVAHKVKFKDHHGNNMIYSEKVKGRLRNLKFKPFRLGLGDVVFERPDIVLRTYKGEDAVNVAVWAGNFQKKDNPSDFILTSNSTKIEHGRFVLINDNQRTVFDTKGNPDIDYAFFELADISLDADDFYLKNADVAMKINALSLKQYGGFDLDKCSGNFRICDTTLTFDNLRIKTKDSDLDLDLKFRYDRWQTYADFLDSVQISSKIRPSILSMDDIADFAPAIRGMNEVFYLTCDSVRGYVNDFWLDKANVVWLGKTKVCGDIAITDVTDFKNALFNVSLDSVAVNVPDISKFALPKGRTIPINRTLSKFGQTSFRGDFSGSAKDFATSIDAKTGLGPATVYLEVGPTNGKLEFHGNVTSQGFNLAKLTGKPKIFGSSSMDISIDGHLPSTEYTGENFRKAEAHVRGNVGRLPLIGYPLRKIRIDGDYHDQLYNAMISIDDTNLRGRAVAQLDISQDAPALQGSVSLDRFAIGEIASKLPPVDSATATGIDKVVAVMQRNPSVQVSFDHFQIALHGRNINDVNGFVGCDNIKLKYNEDSLQNERLRLTAINSEYSHKYLLSSNIANASYEASYPIVSVFDSLQNLAHMILPSIVPASKHHSGESSAGDSEGYIKLNIRTYNTRPLTKLFIPDMFIAPNSTVSLSVNDGNNPDFANVSLPFFSIRNKVRLHNFRADGSSEDGKSMSIDLDGDSIIVFMGKNRLLFDNVKLAADERNNIINYDLSWHNAFNSEGKISQLKGNFDITSTNDIVIHLDTSRIYLKDYECHFNDSNEIRIQTHKYIVDNLTFSTNNSSLAVNGEYDTRNDSRLTLAAKNMDISLINPLLESVSFDGRMFANMSLLNRSGRRVILGKTIVNEFKMNESRLGDVFLVAGVSDSNDIRFSGGMFNADFPIKFESLSTYTMRTFTDETNKTATVSGTYAERNLDVRAIFDTLQADFLAPFLSSFSNKLTGTASGDLAFHASPDSTYFDGNVHVIDAKMGIAPLGTEYTVRNQEIRFDKRGIFFDNMLINDKDGNKAFMTGEVLHKMFKDMKINLGIRTDRILALNTQRTQTSFFYGTGYVSGEISITSDSKGISFVGPDIGTLEGSKVVLQVSSTNLASEAEQIHFKVNTADKKEEVAAPASSTDLNFDFTFDVTNDADVVLVLESLGGTMNARADGRFQLLYSTKDNLNLYGTLLLHSGDFRISLYDVVNSKFTLVPGGSIRFDGPLENMVVNMSAYKTSKTSLNNIIPSEYLPSNNVNVNAAIHLNGPLMKSIEPTFSFELPNSSSEVRNLFYTAIDTQNTENVTKQFAYFLITNSFMPNNMFEGSGLNISGLSIFSNIVNNMLGRVIDSKIGSFGITYNQATETSSAEYGLKANANLLKDRVTMSTSIGYYDDRQRTDAYNNIYGNFAVEYNINKTGTWKLKAYTYIGERDDNYFYESNYNNYTAGVAMSYKKDFDVRKRGNKVKKERKSKKNKKTENRL